MPCPASAAPSPIPDSISRCGVAIAPLHTTTSRAAPITTRLPSARRTSTPDRPAILHHDPLRRDTRLDPQVRPLQRRAQIGLRRAHPAAVADVHLHRRHALDAAIIDVPVQREPRRLAGRDIGRSPLAKLPRLGDRDRAALAAGGAGRPLPILDLLEHGQHVVPRPAPRPRLRPAVIVMRRPAQEHQPVHRARPAQHLAARPGDRPPVQFRLRLGRVAPIIAAGFGQPRIAGRDMDPDVAVRRPRLQQHDPVARILRQPRCQDAPGRPAARPPRNPLSPSHAAPRPAAVAPAVPCALSAATRPFGKAAGWHGARPCAILRPL